VKLAEILISVVVCTYNREELLADCLKSLACQTFNPAQYEVIVVDNNSSDNTRSVAEEFVKVSLNFRLIAEPEQGLSYARNRGLAEARGAYVAFIDDDARAPESWLENAARIMAAHSPDIFGGPAIPFFGCETPAWYKDCYGVRGDMGETGWITEGFIVGTNIFFLKVLLEEYGGFDPELGMKGDSVGYHEETALVYRAFAEGKKVYYAKELAVKDRMPDYKLSLAYFLYSKYKVGYDGIKIWRNEYPVESFPELLDVIDNTMNSFDFALRKRDTVKYAYPENYIVEELSPLLAEIGKRVNYFKGRDLYEMLGVNDRKESIDEALQRLTDKNGYWKIVKALMIHMVRHIFNLSGRNNNANVV